MLIRRGRAEKRKGENERQRERENATSKGEVIPEIGKERDESTK